MDVFKFHNPTSPTKMEQGEIVNGFTSKMWIERYRESGEFKLVAPVYTRIREKLPIGSFISHLDTKEIMIVENHEINDDKDEESEITITGRGFESFFEHRIVGSNKIFPFSGILVNLTLAAEKTWNQAIDLITRHIYVSDLVDDDNALPYITVQTAISGSGVSIARKVERGDLYSLLLGLLEIDNLGIKVIRPGPWSPLGEGNPDVAVNIHKGISREGTIIFSYKTGEIVSADYLWSNRNFKNAALVTGTWVETVVLPVEIGYDRRMMYLDAAFIDEEETSAPTGTTLDDIVALMQQYGLEAIASQKEVALTKAEVSRKSLDTRYRVDYDVGDFVTVFGDYNEVSFMRISEYVEIEDENGTVGYPTLTRD